MQRLLVLGLILFLAACTTRVDPGIQSIGDSYSIATGRSWSRTREPFWSSDPTRWTIDGFSLGKLQTWAKVGPGDTLLEIEGGDPPTFRAELTEFGIAERVADIIAWATHGAEVDVQISELKSKPFAGVPGFVFQFDFVDAGLPMRGLAHGAVRDGKLDLMLFIAPREYYFDYYRPEVERIFDSVRAI